VIRTFLFDMGNVLVHFCHDRMCAQIGALCGRSGAEVRTLLIDSGLQWDFERGRLSEDQFRRRLETVTGCQLDLAKLRHAGSDIFSLNEPIVPVLDALKQRDYRLVLLSNTSIAHFEFVSENFDVLSRFDECVTSYRVGAVKPERPMYEAAQRAIRCAPDECFYTDDIPGYIDAARSYGFQAEVFSDVPALLQQLAHRGITLDN
jgi:putative hydrolase of the HAD superfamily